MRNPSKRLVTLILIILLISMSVFPFAQATDGTPPTIADIGPSSGEQGQTIDLTISGTDFVDGASVSFSPPTGITVTSVEFVNHMELRATVTIAIDADAGLRDVTVTNPDSQSHTLSGGFTVTEAKLAIPAITGLTATDAHDGKVDLTWNPSEAENFAHYAIYVAETEITDVTGLSPTATITDIAVHMYQVTGLKDGTEYYFAVTAVDTTDNENKAVTAASTIPTPSITPTPTGLPLDLILIIVLVSLAVIGGLVYLHASLTKELTPMEMEGQWIRFKFKMYNEHKFKEKKLAAGWMNSIMRELEVLPPRPKDMTETDFGNAIIFGIRKALGDLARDIAGVTIPDDVLPVLLGLYELLGKIFKDPTKKAGKDTLLNKLKNRGFSDNEAFDIIDELERVYNQLKAALNK